MWKSSQILEATKYGFVDWHEQQVSDYFAYVEFQHYNLLSDVNIFGSPTFWVLAFGFC